MAETTPQNGFSVLHTETPRLRPWRELAIVAFIFMEMSWLVLWYRILIRLGRAVSYEKALLVMVGLLLVSYSLARLMDYLDLRVNIRRVVLAGLLGVSLLIGFRMLVQSYAFTAVNLGDFLRQPVRSLWDIANVVPTELTLTLVVLLVWWRGISLVGKQIGPVGVIAGFRTGVLSFFGYGLLLPFIGEVPGPALYLFLFFSLIAMSAARIAVLSHLRGGQRIPFDRRWLGGIFFVVLTVVGLSWFFTAMMRGQMFTLLTNLYTWAVYLLLILVSPLLLLFMRLIFIIGEWLQLAAVLRSILTLIDKLQETFQKWLEGFRNLFENVNIPEMRQFMDFLLAARVLLFWGILALAVLIVLMTLRRTIWRDTRQDDQENQTTAEPSDLVGLLREALRKSFGKMLEGLGQRVRFPRADQLLAAARIRRVYARLLQLSAKLDHPRPESRTPLEFLPSLESLFPEQIGDLKVITNAYLRVRYGELSETLQEVEAVEQAWRRISAEGRAKLSSRKNK